MSQCQGWVVDGVQGCIGHTPLVRLGWPVRARVWAKMEMLNPGGSIKDRAALYMINHAERHGLLKPGGTIVEASSGNQGIALAMIGAMRGYRVIITVPDRTAAEKTAMLRAYGAEVYVCPNTASHDDPAGYHAMAERLAHDIPGAFMPDQYRNPLNAEAHEKTTGPEIWEQTGGRVTHVFVAAGTCGTLTGVGRFLKRQNPAVQIVGVDAENSLYSTRGCPRPYAVEGLGIDVGDILDKDVVDRIVPISDEDAFAATRQVAREQGLLVGISSGAVIHVARKAVENWPESAEVVLVLADSGRSYMGKIFGAGGPA